MKSKPRTENKNGDCADAKMSERCGFSSENNSSDVIQVILVLLLLVLVLVLTAIHEYVNGATLA